MLWRAEARLQKASTVICNSKPTKVSQSFLPAVLVNWKQASVGRIEHGLVS